MFTVLNAHTVEYYILNIPFETETKIKKAKAGDHGDFGTLDVLRSIAICDHLNDSDQEKFAARMELLRRNQDLETQSASKLTKNINKFFESPTEADTEPESEDSAGLDHFTRMCLVAQVQYEMALRTVSGDGDTEEDSDEDESSNDDEDINENVQVTLKQSHTVCDSYCTHYTVQFMLNSFRSNGQEPDQTAYKKLKTFGKNLKI